MVWKCEHYVEMNEWGIHREEIKHRNLERKEGRDQGVMNKKNNGMGQGQRNCGK